MRIHKAVYRAFLGKIALLVVLVLVAFLTVFPAAVIGPTAPEKPYEY